MSDVKISRQEESLYGFMAPVVRHLGNALTAAENARTEAINRLTDSQEADSHASIPAKAAQDEQGRSEHTVWMDSVYERLYVLERSARDTLHEIAAEALEAERKMRSVVASVPAVDVTA